MPPWVSEAGCARQWQTLYARLARAAGDIQATLATVRKRAAVAAQRPTGPTQLELARLEAARRLRESIEREIQAFLDELDQRR